MIHRGMRSSTNENGRSGISTLFLLVIILTVVLAFAVGSYFLIARSPPSQVTSETSITATTTTVTATTSIPSTVSHTASVSNVVSLTSKSTTTVISMKDVTTTLTSSSSSSQIHLNTFSLSGNIIASGRGSHADSIIFREQNGSTYSSPVIEGQYSVIIPNDEEFNVTVHWSGAYYWQAGAQIVQYHSNATSSSESLNWSISTPSSEVSISGVIGTSGEGTQASRITLVSAQNQTYTAPVLGARYNITVPNDDTFEASVSWIGMYPWQGGSISLGALESNVNTSSYITQNWNIATPSSEITVSGVVNTTGKGTYATAVSFHGDKGSLVSVPVIDQEYTVNLPNFEYYNLSVSWSGSYSFQRGYVDYGLELGQQAGISSVTINFENIQTPDSEITVNGTVYTTGTGTHFTGITFSSKVAGIHLVTGNGSQQYYSITLPNLASYNVSIAWVGQYPWQKGNEDSGQFSLDLNSGSYLSKNWVDVQTPNSNIVVSGSVSASGFGVLVSAISFSSTHGSYAASVYGSTYTLSVPNMANYSIIAKYTGEYPWQNGSASFPLDLNGGVGVSTFVADWNIPAPNSVVSVSGTLTYSGGVAPFEVRFVSGVDGINYTASVTNGAFSISLPNDVNYTVIVYFTSQGSSFEEDVGTFGLFATPGVSVIYASWSV